MEPRTSVALTPGQVTSADGTRIGYLRVGSGPGLLILHGGSLAGRHYLKLAGLLADEFTVYLPDRRGRGTSGPYRDDHSIETEDADLTALVRSTGARYAFGTADGGLFALHAAQRLGELEKIIAYEPVVFAGQAGQQEFSTMIDLFDRRIAAGDGLGAAAGATKAAWPGPLQKVPDGVYRAMFGLGFWIDERRAPEGYALGKLLPTLRSELRMVRDTEGTLESYRAVTAAVLLLRGSRAMPLITGSVDALQQVLPNAQVRVLPGLLHSAAQDSAGRPRPIAAAVRTFLEG